MSLFAALVRATYKTEDVVPVEPEMARNLKAKFENWKSTDVDRENNKNASLDVEDYTPSIDMTKNLKAKFEQIKFDNMKPVAESRPKFRVNRFVVSRAALSCFINV